jgi:hypothetical protein
MNTNVVKPSQEERERVRKLVETIFLLYNLLFYMENGGQQQLRI